MKTKLTTRESLEGLEAVKKVFSLVSKDTPDLIYVYKNILIETVNALNLTLTEMLFNSLIDILESELKKKEQEENDTL